jgi:hypothetical protein
MTRMPTPANTQNDLSSTIRIGIEHGIRIRKKTTLAVVKIAPPLPAASANTQT